MALDWGIGEYEPTAAELEPVARHVVELAAPGPGDRVLDIACGTGNAALLAARAGALATGLDGSPRLVEVARAGAVRDGLDATFVVGDLHHLPFRDGSFDVAISIFGVIFATDPDRAIAEIVRVLAPDGRGLVTVWLPGGAIDAMVGVAIRAVQDATGASAPRFPWSDRAAVAELCARHGAEVEFEDASLAFTAPSPDAYFANVQSVHPMYVSTRALLERAGKGERVAEQMLAALREGNEDPHAFRATSRYRIAQISARSAAADRRGSRRGERGRPPASR